MRISDWSSDVCSSDLKHRPHFLLALRAEQPLRVLAIAGDHAAVKLHAHPLRQVVHAGIDAAGAGHVRPCQRRDRPQVLEVELGVAGGNVVAGLEVIGVEARFGHAQRPERSEEHTSELQSLMRISYAVFCLEKKTKETNIETARLTKKRITREDN